MATDPVQDALDDLRNVITRESGRRPGPVQAAFDDLRETIYREAERQPGPLTEVRLAQERLDAALAAVLAEAEADAPAPTRRKAAEKKGKGG